MFVLTLLFGLIFGSFISALTWRIPRGINILSLDARSICPKCKKEINWNDNIPLLSFIFLRGKCRNCKKKISWRYPLIELTTAIGFVSIFCLQGQALQAVYSILIFLILEAIFVIDLEHQIIPDELVYLGVGISLYAISYTLYASILAGLISAALLLIIHLATRGKGMGLGDVKFAVLGGMLVGLPYFLVWLFFAFLTGAIVGIILILIGNAGLKSKIAFGPFLVISIPVTLLFGQQFIKMIGF